MTFQKITGEGEENQERRRKLLAMIHIAKEALCWSDIQYRCMLEGGFDVPTAAALTIEQLGKVVDFFIREGWEPQGRKKTKQTVMLQKRVMGFVSQIPGGEKRVDGLCLKLCGVAKVQWCDDPAKLKRLLAAMGNIKRKEVVISAVSRGVG